MDLKAVFTAAIIALPSAALATREPSYNENILGFPNQSYYLNVCDENKTQLQAEYFYHTTDQNYFGTILGDFHTQQADTNGVRYFDYWVNITEAQRLDLEQIYNDKIDHFLEKNIEDLLKDVPEVTQQTRAEHRDMQMYGYPSIRDTFSELNENVREMSINLANELGWDYINAGFYAVQITPNSAECSSGPSIEYEEVRWN